jgi:hypothetical protein
MHEEGWFRDPYGLHEDRWFSNGAPTKLVRDGNSEHYDAPPSNDLPVDPLVRSDSPSERPGPENLLRADDAEQPPDYSQKAFDVIAQFLPPGI